ALLLAVVAALSGVSIYNLAAINESMRTITTDALPGITYISAADALVMEYRGDALKHLATTSDVEMAQLESGQAALKEKLLQSLQRYGQSIHQAEDRELFAALMPAFERFERSWKSVLPISRAGQ